MHRASLRGWGVQLAVMRLFFHDHTGIIRSSGIIRVSTKRYDTADPAALHVTFGSWKSPRAVDLSNGLARRKLHIARHLRRQRDMFRHILACLGGLRPAQVTFLTSWFLGQLSSFRGANDVFCSLRCQLLLEKACRASNSCVSSGPSLCVRACATGRRLPTPR